MSGSVRPRRQQPTKLPGPWDSPGKNTGVGCCFFLQCMKVKSESEVAQSYPTLSDPMDCSPPGSFVHGILQARVLEWGILVRRKSLIQDLRGPLTSVPTAPTHRLTQCFIQTRFSTESMMHLPFGLTIV